MNNKEIRIYVINASSGFDFKYALNNGDYTSIMDEAEEQGGVYSLNGFQMAINNGELLLGDLYVYIGGTK